MNPSLKKIFENSKTTLFIVGILFFSFMLRALFTELGAQSSLSVSPQETTTIRHQEAIDLSTDSFDSFQNTEIEKKSLHDAQSTTFDINSSHLETQTQTQETDPSNKNYETDIQDQIIKIPLKNSSPSQSISNNNHHYDKLKSQTSHQSRKIPKNHREQLIQQNNQEALEILEELRLKKEQKVQNQLRSNVFGEGRI